MFALSLQFVLIKVKNEGQKAASSIDKVLNHVSEILSGIRIIKAFNSQDRELNRSKQLLRERYDAELETFRYQSLVGPLTETLGILGLIIILFLGNLFLSDAEGLSLALLSTYAFALFRLLPRLNQVNNLRSQYSMFSSSLDIIAHFLSNTVASIDTSERNNLASGIESKVEFKDVEFTFPGSSAPTLKNLNLIFPKGKTTAIVGSSGSGKSTLVDLLMRLYSPTEGEIKVDDIDLEKLSVSSWRSQLAIVNQDTFLFNTSVSNNIAYGKPDATQDEIIEAAKQAYAYDFIMELPEQFDTVLGNRGLKLSGGQRQRIAIARAIIRKPDILILDEATSALDTTSEKIVQQAIEEVSQNYTVIIVAHRLSTIKDADQIIVLHQGKVVEEGTHDELISLRGSYFSLYSIQSKPKVNPK